MSNGLGNFDPTQNPTQRRSDGGTSFDPSQVQAKTGKRRSAPVEAKDDGLISMTAKHAGRCKGCGGRIQPGDAILWAKGKGAWHDKESCAPEITTPTDPEAKLKPRNPASRGEDLQKRGDDEFDVPIVIRVRAPAYNVAVEEVMLMLKDAMERWPVPMKMKLMGKKAEK